MSRKKLHALLLVICLGSYAWLAYCLEHSHGEAGSQISLCWIKTITGFPCPSCGITRGILLLLAGEVVQAMAINPLSVPAFVALGLVPLWIMYDLLKRQNTLLSAYSQMETLLGKKRYAVPVFALLSLNWCWNIFKQL